MKDRSEDPSHHVQTLLPQSYILLWNEKQLNGSTMKDRSNDPSHHERTLLPRSYISLHPSDGGLKTVNIRHPSYGGRRMSCQKETQRIRLIRKRSVSMAAILNLLTERSALLPECHVHRGNGNQSCNQRGNLGQD